MEEEIIKTTVSPSQPEVVTEIPKKNLSVVILLVILGLLVVAGAVYAAFEMGKKQIQPNVVAKPTVTPQATEVSPALDETANWKTYTNSVHNISFKYPLSWSFTEENGQNEGGKIYNTKVELSKGDALITMYLNMNGIGGISQTYEGKAFVLDGHNLYQFNNTNNYNSTKVVGISDSLTSLGVFMVDNITYSITVTYPANYKKLDEENLLKEFDQILSTFKFTN